MTLVQGLAIFSGLSFLVYGVLCVATENMKKEFERFGLRKFRVMTGLLEILGGLGLLIGLWWPPATVIASAGLTALMFLGVGVRLWIKDSLFETLPALSLMFVNLYILVETLYGTTLG